MASRSQSVLRSLSMRKKLQVLPAVLLPRLRDILFVILFVGALFTGERMLNTDSDVGRDLALGTYMLREHQIPTHDLLSFTKAGQSRPPYEWLAQVLFAAAYRLMGLDGVVLLAALVIALSFSVVYRDAMRRSEGPMLALWLTAWGAAASSLHWLTRPHIFSFLMFALWLEGLERIRKNQSIPLWRFPVGMLVWANLHGGFVFGFLAWAAYLFGCTWEAWRKSVDPQVPGRLLKVGALSLIASVATPDLWHNWEAVLNNRSSYILSHTVETMPPDLRLPGVWPFLGMLVLAIVLLSLNRRRSAATHWLLLAGLAAAGFLMARNIPFFAIAAVPILAEWIRQSFARFEIRTRLEQGFARIDSQLFGFVWPVLITAGAAGVLLVHEARAQTSLFNFNPQIFPVQAADWLEAHPQNGNMFNDFNWGGYLLYRLWPGQRVFIDSQSDFYGETFVRQYEQIRSARGEWQAGLAQYAVQWVILPRQAPLADVLGRDPNWQVDYQDPIAIIFSHK